MNKLNELAVAAQIRAAKKLAEKKDKGSVNTIEILIIIIIVAVIAVALKTLLNSSITEIFTQFNNFVKTNVFAAIGG